MIAAIVGALTALLGQAIIRMLIGAGLALITYQGVSGFTDSLVLELENQIGGLPANMVSIMAMAGAGRCIEIMISTVTGVAAVAIAGRVVGVKRT